MTVIDCDTFSRMRMDFAYGKTGISVGLPPSFTYQILEARSAEPLPDSAASIEAALDAPFAGPSLSALASGKRTAAISVCDITRPAPNRQILPPILERLHRAGITKEAVTILIATGLHRPATESEILEILGPQIASSYRVVNHNARELSEHRALGKTQSGTPVYI